MILATIISFIMLLIPTGALMYVLKATIEAVTDNLTMPLAGIEEMIGLGLAFLCWIIIPLLIIRHTSLVKTVDSYIGGRGY